ncbi:transporter substrate-binding domain-containing protein [Ureibacillus composti]|nr:transporter substrate-binding domain-containing protein [Niallia sp.]
MKKTWLWTISSAVLLLAACSSNTATEEKKEKVATSAKTEDVQKIVVGTGTQFPNICFIDEDGNLNGYDIEMVKAIDEKLPEYEFEFQTMDFPNLLVSLETDKIDFVAHQMEVTEEREEKYLFNKEPYNVFPLKVTVHQDNNEIQSIEDLKGKKVGATPTSSSAVLLEKYNSEHDLGAEIVYSQSSVDSNQQLKTGRIDAIVSTPFAVDFVNEQSDAQQKVVGDALSSSKVFFLFNKDETALADRIDEALVELKEEGVVSELSLKWLGADYSVDF